MKPQPHFPIGKRASEPVVGPFESDLTYQNDKFVPLCEHNQLFDPRYHTPLETPTGNPSAAPALDDTTAAANSVQISEATQSSKVQLVGFGNFMLQAWTFRTNIVACSEELFTDSNFPIGSVLEKAFALRHARGVGVKLVNGSGVNT